MAKIIRIEDPATICCFKFKISNSKICAFFAVVQLVVASGAVAQHIYSLVEYGKIFKCYFGAKPTSDKEDASSLTARMLRNITDHFLAADIIIFDYGLFHVLLGFPGCVANQFDNGFMRAFWCVSYVGSLSLLLVVLALRKPRPRALLPILLQQSVYMLGLIMLTLATIRKLLSALSGHMSFPLFRLIFCYLFGASYNCYFGITLWHFYWFWKRAIKTGIQSPVHV